MGTPLFNINDLALLLVMAQCGLLILILWQLREKAGQGYGWLSLLLLSFALHAADTLMYWSVPIKYAVASALGTWPFWLFKWAAWLQGPLLYGYIRAKLTGRSFSRRDIKHFWPLPLYLLIVLMIIWELGYTRWLLGLYDYGELLRSHFFVGFNWLVTLSALSYGILALIFMRQHSAALVQTHSDAASVEPVWLRMVAWGYVALWLFILLAKIAEGLSLLFVSHALSLLTNYLSFAFITSLVSYSLLKSHFVMPSAKEPEPERAKTPDFPTALDQAEAKRLKALLYSRELYLDPELTLEQFAKSMHLPERQVSQLINHCLGNNFFELVNIARVDRAKTLLIDQPAWPVQRVFEEAGFNSKPSFNRLFKRYAHATPSEYRVSHSNTNSKADE